MAKFFKYHRRNNHGFVLIFVLWTIIILMIVGASFMFRSKSHRQSLSHFQKSILYKQYSKNGILLSMSKIQQDTNKFDHASERDPQDTIHYKTQKIKNIITVTDIGSLFNVNFTPMNLIRQTPHITEEVINIIQKFRSESHLIMHLYEIDPTYKNHLWASFLTVYGTPNLNTTPPPLIYTFLQSKGVSTDKRSLIIQGLNDLHNSRRNSDIQENKGRFSDTLRSEDIKNAFKDNPLPILDQIPLKSGININTAPSEVLVPLLKSLGLSSAEIKHVQLYIQDSPFYNNLDFDEEEQDILAPNIIKVLQEHLSFHTSFYRIVSELVSENEERVLLKTEAILQKNLLESSLRIIYWIVVNYD